MKKVCDCCKKNNATKKDYRSWDQSKLVYDVCDKCLSLPDNIFNAMVFSSQSDESLLKSKKHNKMGGIMPKSAIKDLTKDS